MEGVKMRKLDRRCLANAEKVSLRAPKGRSNLFFKIASVASLPRNDTRLRVFSVNYIVFIIAILASFSVVYALAQVPQTQSKTAQEQVDEEDLSLDPYTWDFGDVSPEDVLQHTFILTNESSVVLNIKQVNTSCGCTASEVKKKQLQPGESTDINVTFKAKGYKGAAQQFVYVNTDSLDNPVIRYIIKANVVK